MFKRHRFLFAILYGCFAAIYLPSQGHAASLFDEPRAVQANQEHGLFWQITKAGKRVGYLFGTMHTEDARVLAIGQQVQPKVEDVKCLAIELELNQESSMKVAQAMFFNDGQQLPQIVSKETFAKLAQLLARDYALSSEQALAMKPWAAMMMLSMPKSQTGMFLDRALYLEAVSKQFKVFSLETPEEQIAVMDEMSLEDQVSLLEDVLVHYEKMPEMFEQLAIAYLQQDLAAMQNLYRQYTQGADRRLIDKLTERLLTTRNERMIKRMIKIYADHQCIVAVGALHLPGDVGLLNLLRKYGYGTTPLKLNLR